jgi:hypothetical protein
LEGISEIASVIAVKLFTPWLFFTRQERDPRMESRDAASESEGFASWQQIR